jgi:arylsulfatase A-like enzyme
MLSHRPLVANADCSYAARILIPDRGNARNQSRCAFEAMVALLARLRELGIYDNTTVVISGDHGIFLAPDSLAAGSAGAARAHELGLTGSMIGHARPLLLVKPARSHGALRRSQAPTWIVDTPATIADAAGFTVKPEGRSALRLAPGEPRERRFLSYEYMQSDWTAEHLAPMQEYLVEGRGDRAESWSVGRRFEAAR